LNIEVSGLKDSLCTCSCLSKLVKRNGISSLLYTNKEMQRSMAPSWQNKGKKQQMVLDHRRFGKGAKRQIEQLYHI